MWVPWNFMTTCVQVCPGKAMLWFLKLPCIQIQPSGKQPTNSNSLSRLSPNSELPPWDQPRHTTAGETPRKGWHCLQFELRRGIRCTHHWDTGQCQKEFKSGPSTPKTKDTTARKHGPKRVKTFQFQRVLQWPSLLKGYPKVWKTTTLENCNCKWRQWVFTPTRCQEVYQTEVPWLTTANILSRDYGMPRTKMVLSYWKWLRWDAFKVHAQLRDMTTNQPVVELTLRCALGSSSSSQSLHSLGQERTPQWQRLGRIKVLCQHGSST